MVIDVNSPVLFMDNRSQSDGSNVSLDSRLLVQECFTELVATGATDRVMSDNRPNTGNVLHR